MRAKIRRPYLPEFRRYQKWVQAEKFGQTMSELLWSLTRSFSSAARTKTVKLLEKLPEETRRIVDEPQRTVRV